MNYKILIEGQTLELPEEWAGTDSNLKAALTPYFPGAVNAKFMRSEPKDGVITVTVVKQAGTKGAETIIDDPQNLLFVRETDARKTSEPEDQVMRKLIDAREGMNPVVELHRLLEGKTLNQMGVEKLLQIDQDIDQALDVGRKERDSIDSTLSLLVNTEAKPAPIVMVGF